jgi:general secretion pathway protein I
MKKGGRSGFTLIEVVVAMAILGISLVLVIELFSGGLRLGRASEEYTQASHYAQVKLEEIALTRQIEEGSDEGQFDSAYRWQMEVKKVEILHLESGTDYTPPADFFQIRLRIIWKSGRQEKTATIETFKTVKPETDETKTS